MPTTALQGTSGGYSSIATKSRGTGTSGWNVEREEGCSYGLTSTRSSLVIPCQRPGSSTATPAGTNLSREEPDGGNLRVRICGGRGWQRPRLPGTSRSFLVCGWYGRVCIELTSDAMGCQRESAEKIVIRRPTISTSRATKDARRCRRFATEQKAQRLQGYRRNGKSGQYYTDSTPASVLVLRACYVEFNPRILKVSVQLGMHWSGPRSAMLNANGTLRARLFMRRERVRSS